MFLLVSGAAASGKSTYARLLGERLEGIDCHDADEVVARTSDERCEQLEVWVQQALDAQQRGVDFLLTTHSPLGELLACPSAPLLDGIATCLLDCADEERVRRYLARGVHPDWSLTEHTLNWAAWHRRHARDPRWQPHVIDRNGPATQRYDRWRAWPSDDSRWQVFVLDTTNQTVEQTLPLLLGWVQRARTTSSSLTSRSRWAEHP